MPNKHAYDIIYMQGDCLYRYNKRMKKSYQDGKADFDKFNIFRYILECYELLEHWSSEEIVSDICKRIKGGVVF